MVAAAAATLRRRHGQSREPLDYVLDLRELQASGVLTMQERQAIERENVVRMLKPGI